MSTAHVLDGVLTALITPCDDRGEPSEVALGSLIEFQASTGVRGLFILGTAGQGPLLTDGERRRLTELIIALAKPELRVVVHIGTLPTPKAIELARHAIDAGADAIASVPPTYYQPDWQSVRVYYESLAEAASEVPLLAYNNPAATGYDLRPEEAAALHADGVIAGVKQAAASVADLHALLRGGVPVWMANATLNTAALTMGVSGTISTVTNVLPELFVGLYDAVQSRDLSSARGLQERIDRGAEKLRVPIIGALHAAVTARGLPGLAPRPPLRLPEPEELGRICSSLDELGDPGARAC